MKHCSKCDTDRPLTDFGRNKNAPDGMAYWCKPCQRESMRLSYQKHRDARLAGSTAYAAAHADELKAYKQRYHQENRDAILEKQAQYRRDNPDLIREERKRYKETHGDKIKADNAAYRANNAEKIRDYRAATANERRAYQARYLPEYRERPDAQVKANARNQRYRQSHPDKGIEHTGKRRARKQNAPTVEAVKVTDIIKRDKAICHICLKPARLFAPAHHPDGIVLDHVIPLSKGGSHTAANLKVAHRRCNGKKGAKLSDSSAQK